MIYKLHHLLISMKCYLNKYWTEYLDINTWKMFYDFWHCSQRRIKKKTFYENWYSAFGLRKDLRQDSVLYLWTINSVG